jgi:hypothetical protein
MMGAKPEAESCEAGRTLSSRVEKQLRYQEWRAGRGAERPEVFRTVFEGFLVVDKAFRGQLKSGKGCV